MYIYIYMYEVVLKFGVFWLYSGDHFTWFQGLAELSRKKTPKDYMFFAKPCVTAVSFSKLS